MKWELEEAYAALLGNNLSLALRYLEKALEQVRCMYCHGRLDDGRAYHAHFKGFVHDECSERYHGRSDYLCQHPHEAETLTPALSRGER